MKIRNTNADCIIKEVSVTGTVATVTLYVYSVKNTTPSLGFRVATLENKIRTTLDSATVYWVDNYSHQYADAYNISINKSKEIQIQIDLGGAIFKNKKFYRKLRLVLYDIYTQETLWSTEELTLVSEEVNAPIVYDIEPYFQSLYHEKLSSRFRLSLKFKVYENSFLIDSSKLRLQILLTSDNQPGLNNMDITDAMFELVPEGTGEYIYIDTYNRFIKSTEGNFIIKEFYSTNYVKEQSLLLPLSEREYTFASDVRDFILITFNVLLGDDNTVISSKQLKLKPYNFNSKAYILTNQQAMQVPKIYAKTKLGDVTYGGVGYSGILFKTHAPVSLKVLYDSIKKCMIIGTQQMDKSFIVYSNPYKFEFMVKVLNTDTNSYLQLYRSSESVLPINLFDGFQEGSLTEEQELLRNLTEVALANFGQEIIIELDTPGIREAITYTPVCGRLLPNETGTISN